MSRYVEKYRTKGQPLLWLAAIVGALGIPVVGWLIPATHPGFRALLVVGIVACLAYVGVRRAIVAKGARHERHA